MAIIRGGAHTHKTPLPDLVSLVEGVGNFTAILRHPDKSVAIKMAECMLYACNNDNIGYSQGLRNGLYNATRNNGYDPRVVTSLVHCDCSSLVALCCLYAGLKCNPGMTTSTEKDELKALGFLLIENGLTQVLVGDVLWRSGHTELIVSASGELNDFISFGSSSGGGSHSFGYSSSAPKYDVSYETSYTSINEYSYKTIFKDVEYEVSRDEIYTVDANEMGNGGYTNLLSYPSLVEVPFILFKVGNHTFGKYYKEGSGSSYKVEYPNYIDSMTVKKISGQLNLYTINLTYLISTGDDPNLLDKIFSSVGYGKVYISYGDYSSPSFIYKEEEAIITKVTSNVDFANSKIVYLVNCTSSAMLLVSNTFLFARRTAKPSDVIKELLNDDKYGLKLVFTGMSNLTTVSKNNLIVSDDLVVEILAKNCDPLTYLNYLVTCMSSTSNSVSEDSSQGVLKDSTYKLCIFDDNFGNLSMNGTYFKISKITSSAKTLLTEGMYSIDIGYPTDNNVLSFSVGTDNSWSLLYKYSEDTNHPQYKYDIDSKGNLTTTYSPNVAVSDSLNKMTETQKSWWTNMTLFPISAQVTLKGLVRPTILMTYIKVNALFFGLRHITSGLYIITGLDDSISSNGYQTTLNLTRIAGDNDYIKTTKTKVTSKIPVGFETLATLKQVEIKNARVTKTANDYPPLTDVFPGSAMYGSSTTANVIEDTFVFIVELCIANGYTINGVCGLIGNILHEGGLDPTTVEYSFAKDLREGGVGGCTSNSQVNKYITNWLDSGQALQDSNKLNRRDAWVSKTSGTRWGYGIILWTDLKRKLGLIGAAQKLGLSVGDIRSQVSWMLTEIKSNYKPVYKILTTSHNTNECTTAVFSLYEAPGDGSLPKRLDYAIRNTDLITRIYESLKIKSSWDKNY